MIPLKLGDSAEYPASDLFSSNPENLALIELGTIYYRLVVLETC